MELRAATAALRRIAVSPIVVDYRVPPKRGLAFAGRLACNLFSPLPYSVVTHASRAMGAEIDQLLATDPPDLWHCEWTPYAQAMRGRDVPWMVMAHNVESLIWQRYTEAEKNPLKKAFLHQQYAKFEAFEGWAYTAATRTVAVSREDADLIEGRFSSVSCQEVASAELKPDQRLKMNPVSHRYDPRAKNADGCEQRTAMAV